MMKITLEYIYVMYIQITVKINRWLKREYFGILHVYIIQKFVLKDTYLSLYKKIYNLMKLVLFYLCN